MKYNMIDDVQPFLEAHVKPAEPDKPVRYWDSLVSFFLWEQYGNKHFPNIDFSADVHDLQDVQFVIVRRYFAEDEENVYYDVYDYYAEEHIFVLQFCRNLFEMFFKRIPPILYLSTYKKEGE